MFLTKRVSIRAAMRLTPAIATCALATWAFATSANPAPQAASQDLPLIPPLSAAAINRIWDAEGDLRSIHTRNGDELTITVKRASAGAVESGFAGVCVQNAVPVNLQNFTHVSAVIEASARVILDVKLERSKAQDGTILLMDHATVPAGTRPFGWRLQSADEIGNATLNQTRRMCFFVLAEGFPSRQSEVTVKIRAVKFDIRRNS